MRVYEKQTLKRIFIARILKPDIITTTLCSRLVYNNHKIKKPKSYFLYKDGEELGRLKKKSFRVQ